MHYRCITVLSLVFLTVPSPSFSPPPPKDGYCMGSIGYPRVHVRVGQRRILHNFFAHKICTHAPYEHGRAKLYWIKILALYIYMYIQYLRKNPIGERLYIYIIEKVKDRKKAKVVASGWGKNLLNSCPL